ncbi:unnamed protein product [Adineta ricciae]|uniref:dTMP kinase n=1 Tax=Adineta ricciae TaxID=249248 RepID=A0A815DGF9_ADIRI|nr:unnamed protein product [Adineta ricciae]
MEILQLLRNHIRTVQTSDAFNQTLFQTILNSVEERLVADLQPDKKELSNDQLIVNCIDLEGLDGCGKSTLANELLKQLNSGGQKARLLSTPPSQLLSFRVYFDAQPESIRRAFYNLGNLIVSYELRNQQDTITILDRYWPSTIAYQLAKTDDNEEINITWPTYLVQPRLIIYIQIDEIERCRRIAQRAACVSVTLEEKQLAAQASFRRRLDFLYRNHIPSRNLHVIDGNRATRDIANDILNLL